MKRFFLLLCGFSSLMYGAETAYAWGYGDLMVETLKVVKYIFSVNEFNDVWKLAMLISTTIATIMMITPQTDYFRLPKIIFVSTGVWTIFTVSTIDIYVDDKADNTKSGIVTQVPWAVGYPLALFTTLEYRLGAIYETATSIPNGVRYSDSGFLTPVSIFSQATSHKIVDPVLFQNLDNYITECVIPDLESGYKDYQTLISTDDIWSYMSNTNPTIISQYVNDDNTMTLKGCNDFYSALNSKMVNYVSASGVGMQFISDAINFNSASTVSSILGVANSYLINSSKSASQVLMQNISLNTFSESFKNYATINGGSSSNYAYGVGAGESQANAQMIISGIIGAKYIPVMKGILTVIVIGLTPIMALMMITPIGMKTVIGYMMMLFWLSTWHLGDAILNHIVLTKTKDTLTNLGDVTIQNRGILEQSISNYTDMAGSMYWMIPTIGLIIASGFSLMALSSLNTAMSSSLNRTMASAGASAGLGNANFGNVSHDSYSANKFDSTRTVGQGQSFSYSDKGSFDTSTNAVGGNTASYNNKTSGVFGANTNFGGNSNFNSLMNGAGQGMSFSNINGELSSAGSVNGQSLYSGAGATLTNNQGESVKLGNNALLTQDTKGNYVPYSGNFDATTTDDKGQAMSISKQYNQGEDVSTIAKDKAGNTLELTKDKAGSTQFTWTSGEDKSTYASGHIDSRGNADVSSGAIEGVKFDNSNSSSTTYSAGTMSKMADGINQAWSSGMSKSEASQKALGYSEAFKRGADGKIQLDTKEQLFGMGVKFASGISASGGLGLSLSYDNNGTATYTDAQGKTETISLSGDARKMFESSLQKSMSNEERLSSSRDLSASKLENIINNGFANGQTLNDTMSAVVRNKDAIFNANSSSTGLSSVVNNGLNTDKIDGLNTDKIEKSSLYNQKWKDINNEMKTDAIVLGNQGENLNESNGYNKDKKEVTDQSKFDTLYDATTKEIRKDDAKGHGLRSAKQVMFDDTGLTGVANGVVNGVEKLGVQTADTTKNIATNIPNTYQLNGATYNADGERTGNWHGETPKDLPKTSRELVNELDKNGTVDYSIFGNSEVKDWSKVESLPKEDIQRMIQFNDWDSTTSERLNNLVQGKSDGTNYTPVLNENNNGVANIGNNISQNLGLSDTTTTGNNANPVQLNQGTKFSMTEGYSGLTETLKIADTKGNENKQLEQMALEVDKLDKKTGNDMFAKGS